MKLIYIFLITALLLTSCAEDEPQPAGEKMYCLSKKNPPCFEPTKCQGRSFWRFVKCINTEEGFQYASDSEYKIETCDECK